MLKTYFNQHLECAVPKRWSKYATHIIAKKNSKSLFKPRFIAFWRMEIFGLQSHPTSPPPPTTTSLGNIFYFPPFPNKNCPSPNSWTGLLFTNFILSSEAILPIPLSSLTIVNTGQGYSTTLCTFNIKILWHTNFFSMLAPIHTFPDFSNVWLFHIQTQTQHQVKMLTQSKSKMQ